LLAVGFAGVLGSTGFGSAFSLTAGAGGGAGCTSGVAVPGVACCEALAAATFGSSRGTGAVAVVSRRFPVGAAAGLDDASTRAGFLGRGSAD
jgi:hypothetical protein